MSNRNFIKDALLGVATGDVLDSEAVLQAVNLGDDTDTTAAVTGGLAGLLYGWETIPADWINVLAKRDAIDQLIINLQAKIYR